MTQKKIKYFGFIFWLHLVLVLFAYLSPFLFSWELIVVATIFLSIQYYFAGGCILNKAQFDNTEDIVFLYPYLKMLGLKFSQYKFKIFIRYILPLILLFVAIIWQIVLNNPPLLF